ncbi:MAG TPA: FtsX-like permease family protein [Nitrolancea sp.]|nr:FtsX-like permease family protein [Nitrolancea sp.]
MNAIFGIPTTSLMLALVVIFALCLSSAGFLLVRNRVVFRLGVRNVPRRHAQTLLIVVGLMLSTLIIAAAFGTGDTLDHSIKSQVYEVYGQVDEQITLGGTDTAAGLQTGAHMPESIVPGLDAATQNSQVIDGLMPAFAETVPAINNRTRLFEPGLIATGLDPSRTPAFGGVMSVAGQPIDLSTLPAGAVVLNQRAADKLDAQPGDTLTIYVQNQPQQLSVSAIAANSLLTGYTGAGSSGGFTMALSQAQSLFGTPGQLSQILVSNTGGVVSGVQQSERATSALNGALDGTPYRATASKQQQLDEAEQTGNSFLSIFLIFGLFSISVGILLIFLIFVLLAAERQPEMGVARAVGMKRRQLTEMFLAEGIAYDLISALVGAALGVLVAFTMADFMGRIFGDAFPIRATITWRSLVIAYTLGVVVTFASVLISAWRVSKLNIVAAIRDTPAAKPRRESRRWLLFGALGLALGGLLVLVGASVGSQFPFLAGLSLIPLSLAAVLRRFGVSPRPLYTIAAALVLILWLLPSSLTGRIYPHLTGGIEMFFLSGMMMVASATVLIVWNATIVTRAVSLLGRASSRWLPAIKTAVAYPLERKGRTGMTIAMFSLVVFALVMMAAINANALQLITGSEYASGGWDIVAAAPPTNPISDFRAALSQNNVDPGQIAAIGRLSSMGVAGSRVQQEGAASSGQYPIYGADPSFLEQSRLPLQTRADGYADDAAVWQAVLREPDLALVDSNAIPNPTTIRIGGQSFSLSGIEPNDKHMRPVPVQITNLASGQTRVVRVIGVLDTRVATFPGIMLSEQTFQSIFPNPVSVEYQLRVAPGVAAAPLAKTIESSMVSYGVQAESYRALLDEATRNSRGFLTLIEGFMLLGLIVGIAALGVVSFRSVVERRQQIGMLRAIGYTRAMVAASFVIESTMITVLGIVSGAALGLILAWRLFAGNYFFGTSSSVTFSIPGLEIAAFLAIALLAAVLTAYLPARRAAGVTIAETLRYQ